MARILAVDDEAPIRRLLRSVLVSDGHEVQETDSVTEAMAMLGQEDFDVVLTDERMNHGAGRDLVEHCRNTAPHIPVVMITAYASVELAVDVMRAGAFDFLGKPFQPEVLRSCVRRAAEQAHLRRDNLRMRRELARLQPNDLLGESPPMKMLKEQIARVAPTRATVLIQGETGSGKELVARTIHQSSPRASGPFVAINCSALPEALLETELFGHERGAFTGAERARPGLFEAAHTGTLFLDEAGDMPLPLQAKLLRVLMDGRYTRVGSVKERTTDVRVIAATHRDLYDAVNQQTFREDLYYRLAVVTLHVPALRERLDDLPALCEDLLRGLCADLGIARKQLTPEAFEVLRAYTFPGNVRELRNILERCAILTDSHLIGADELPAGRPHLASTHSRGDAQPIGPASLARHLVTQGLPDGGLRGVIEEIERTAIIAALEASNGVQAEAARRLGLGRSDLFYRLQKYGIAAKP